MLEERLKALEVRMDEREGVSLIQTDLLHDYTLKVEADLASMTKRIEELEAK